MYLTILATFLATLAACAALALYALRRVASHCRESEENTQAVVTHVFVPIFSGRAKPAVPVKPAAPDPVATMVTNRA